MADKKKTKKKAAKAVKKEVKREEVEREVPVSSGRYKKNSKVKSFVKIKVIGVGGAGGNALTRMADDFVRGVELIAVNTDLQDLEAGQARHKLHIGEVVTKGMGAGMNPELGRQAAEENREEIAELAGTDLGWDKCEGWTNLEDSTDCATPSGNRRGPVFDQVRPPMGTSTWEAVIGGAWPSGRAEATRAGGCAPPG